ncbi:MAG: transcription antitermination factor NusB [Rhodospirillaceae bacterium]|nr:transcription antitermination factor NusB [Rhodospirillaceae bacterium]
MSASADTPERAPLDPQGRSASRLAAVQALYQIEVTQDPSDRIIKDFLTAKVGGLAVAQDLETEKESIVALADLDGELFINLVRAVDTRGAEIDEMIKGSLSPDWPWERLEITLRAVLRAGVAELLTRTDIPAGATIAEFVDVAQAFYAGPESGMANAVLDRISRALGRTGGIRAHAGK